MELLGWSSDGARLASGSGKVVKIWDRELALVHTLCHASTVSGIAWRGESGRLVTSAYGGVQFWDAASGEPGRALKWKGSLICMRVSPNGRGVVCGSQDASVHIWKVASGEDLEMSGYPMKVKQLSWSADSRYLATGGGSELCVWDFSGKGPAGTRPQIGRGHVDAIADVAFQSHGHLVASLGRDGVAFVWDARRPTKPLGFAISESPGTKVAWSRKGDAMVVAYESGEVMAWRGRAA